MERPLSPFMFPTWYRFQITSVLSILHRLTGIALTVGSILLAWWLVAVAAGGDVFAATHAFIASPIGVLLLFGWSVAFFYHLCSGIRHLAWDAGYGLSSTVLQNCLAVPGPACGKRQRIHENSTISIFARRAASRISANINVTRAMLNADLRYRCRTPVSITRAVFGLRKRNRHNNLSQLSGNSLPSRSATISCAAVPPWSRRCSIRSRA
jgi:succinate dehydrogenase / fumarate reductase cytochrome b subunit